MDSIKNTATVVLSICIILAVGELLLRMNNDSSRGYHFSRDVAGLPLHDNEHHFCIGPKDRAYYDAEVISREYSDQQYFEFRNRVASLHTYNLFGFRGPSDLEEGQSGVVVIGDSFARGTLADDTETIPAFLDRWYNDITFFNFGIGGHGPKQYLLTYQEYGKFVEHDLVILMLYLGNDAQDDYEFDAKLARAGSAGTALEKQKAKLGSLLTQFEVGKLVLRAYRTIKTKKMNKTDSTIENDVLANVLVKSVTNFSTNVRVEGKRLLIVTLPSREIYDSVNFPESQHRQAKSLTNRLIVELNKYSKSEGFHIVHMSDYFVKLNNFKFDNVYGWPDAHFNEKGYFLTAQRISDNLDNMYGLKRSSAPVFNDKTNFNPVDLGCP